jgi:hypothetical protein
MQAASQDEKAALADLANTTVGTLNQIAGGYRTGGEAVIRAGLARKLEKAAQVLNRRNKSLPTLLRTDLSPECRECEFAQRCLGDKAIMSGFNVIEEK